MVETPAQPEVEDEVPTGASAETISSRKALELLLKQTRASVRIATYIEVVMWSVASVLAYGFTAFSLALMMPKYAEKVVEYTTYGGALVFVGALTWILFALWQTYPSLYDIAARLQSSTPEFRSDIVAALQFSEPDANLSHMSEELALLHVERTARVLVEAKKQVGQLSDLLPQRTYAPPLIAMLAGLTLCYGLYVLRTDDVERLAASLWEEVKPSAQTQKAARSIVGEIDLHYAYPPYSNRAPTYEGFTTGHIKALVGTEVTIKTYPLVEARAFEIVWRTGEDERTIELEFSDERRLETTVNLTKTGTYTFRAIAADGSILEDPLNRTIEVEPDQTPEIVITSHQGEIEVSPNDQLTIEFTVNDDFGIETVNTSSHFAQDDQNATRTALDLPSLINIPHAIDGSTVFDLAPLNLQPKDVVIFSIEATDNNSMTGPSIGKSSPIVLRVTSPADKHQRLIRAQQEVFDALIGVLGSFLESPIGTREVEKKKDVQRVEAFTVEGFRPKFDKLTQAYDEEAIVLQVMQSLSKELEDDPLLLKRDFQTFKGIYERLYRTHRNGVEVLSRVKPKIGDGRIKQRDAQKVADTASKHEHLLEGIVLALEDVLKQQKVDAIEDTAKEIRDIRDRIKELLEKYRETGDPEVKKAIQREIQRLRQRMAELLKRMQSQVQNLPQEHLNMDALEQAAMESKSTDINSDLQSIEEMLQNDDIDGALAALERMSENLDELTQEIGQQSGGPESSGMSALDQELNELMNKLNDIESTQRGLEQETREIQLKAERERDDEVKDLLNKGLGDVEKLAKQQSEQLKKMQSRKLPRHDARSVDGAMQRLEQLQNAIEQRDVEQALDRARELEQDLKSMDFSLELSERYARDKNSVKKDIRSSRKDLKSIVPRSKQITKQLKEIIEKASMQQSSNDPKVGELKQRQSDIEKRTGDLQKEIKDSAQRFPMLDGEMKESIERAKSDMSSSKKGLKKSRVQRSLDFQRSALENLQKVKQSMKNALEKERQGDRKKSDEKVAIPKKDSRDALDIRDEVQKRMKDERLENYDSEIERYYKSLTE